MLARYKKSLELFKRIHELRSDPIGKRSLALEIQETLLKRIGRAEYLTKKRKAKGEMKTKISHRGNSREQSRELKKLYYPFPSSIRDPETLFRFYNGEFVIFISVT